jgi:hypothetical protein
MGVDLRQRCSCEPDGAGGARMAEYACDDGISNDWPQLLSDGALDASSDWLDRDCSGGIGLYNPWYLSMLFRYNLP